MHDHDHHHGDGQHHHHHHDVEDVRAQPVVLDLGGEIGALIVRTSPELLGAEIEISPAGEDGNRQHKQVLRRLLGPETATVLVYDNLAEGHYTLWLDETEPLRGVRVEGGRVAELDLRDATASAVPASPPGARRAVGAAVPARHG
jgi:hypothetical protein